MSLFLYYPPVFESSCHRLGQCVLVPSCVCMYDEDEYKLIKYLSIYLSRSTSINFQTFLYRNKKLSQTIENSVCYGYTSYEMTG